MQNECMKISLCDLTPRHAARPLLRIKVKEGHEDWVLDIEDEASRFFETSDFSPHDKVS
jgi:hypothetical protein